MLGIGLRPAFAAMDRRATVPTIVNLVPSPVDASTWSYLVASYTGPLGLSAVNGYPGYAIASGGAYWHRASYLTLSAEAGDSYAITLLLRAGTSGAVRLWVRDLTANVDHDLSGVLETLSGTSGGLSITSNTLMGDGLTRRIVARHDAIAAGTLEFAVGPFSNVVGADVIVIGAQVEEGTEAHPFVG